MFKLSACCGARPSLLGHRGLEVMQRKLTDCRGQNYNFAVTTDEKNKTNTSPQKQNTKNHDTPFI